MKVIWTPEATQSFNDNIDYLITSWSETIINNFLDRVDEVVQRIKDNPDLYPLVHKEYKIHRCVVVKQISLYYKVTSSDQIDLMVFWNSYRDPEQLPF
ncbi:MAG: type II toxin-antitoxin system RelE/ParE family toxin [Cyclobacteriaceae bacterium]|nr:type II toxin-antitoxin system RelE/ParE family toxin [Cyclobacteriaceae bacterium]